MINNIPSLKSITFEGYWVVFDSNSKHQEYDEGYCYGIKFWHDDKQYELVHNRVGMTRILISADNGFMKDIPFNENTIELMPKGIIFRKIPKEPVHYLSASITKEIDEEILGELLKYEQVGV